MKKLVIFFQWALIITLLGTGLLASWLAIANIIAVQQEKKIEQEIEALAFEFPPTDFNETANQLRQLTPNLGFEIIKLFTQAKTQFSDEQLNIEIAESDRQAWKAISQPLEDYLNQQFSNLDDSITPPPKELQDYLTKHSATLEAIRDIVLNRPSPVWWSDITPILGGDYSFAFPGYLGILELQKILALDILGKQRQGKTSGAIAMLEAAWKLTEDFQDNPTYMGQYVSLRIARYLGGTIRKLDNLPEPWQQRLVGHDYWQSGFTAIEAEVFGHFNAVRNNFGLDTHEFLWATFHWYVLSPPDHYIIPTRKENMYWKSENKYVWRMLDVIVESYSQVSAVDTYQVQMSVLENLQLQEDNVCQSAPLDLGEEETAWWNPWGEIGVPSLTKAQKSMLDLELTQKIIQVKEQAAKAGKWPETVDNLESEICPGFTWVYQVAEDGTMSLSLSQEPDWQADRLKNNLGLPLTYRDRTISQHKVSGK